MKFRILILIFGAILGFYASDAQDNRIASSNISTEFAKRGTTKVPANMDVIQQWQIHEPVPMGQLEDSAYEICRKIGITSLQSYVGWAQLEPEQNKVTYDIYDPVVNQIRKHHLKWLPFIITGPYVATPTWFRAQHGVDAVCLEHNMPIRIQSIWNPELKSGIRRFLELFKAHYDPSVIEALNLGISGNWGESIYPAGGGFEMQGVHTHAGWWCGDKYARADFRSWVKEKFKTVDSLNASWKSAYASFDVVDPFMPQDAPSQRAAVDFGNWYTKSMTNYAEYWVKTAREMFPSLPIYLCTGGDGQVILGADFADQSRMCARYNAGIRITNMDDDMLRGFAITRMVSSATRFYGSYYTNEPGGDNTPKGIAGRVFDIVSGGGRGVYFKGLYQEFKNLDKVPDHATRNALIFADFAKYMIPNSPKLTVAAIMPNSSAILDTKELNQFLERSMKLRDYLDFEYIDENMIGDGQLSSFKAVVLLSGNVLEQSTLDKLKAWVETGGVLITSLESYPLKSVESINAEWVQEPFADKIPFKIVADGTQMPQVPIDKRKVITDFTKKLGNGYVVVLPGKWDTYMQMLGVILHMDKAPWMRLSEPLDGVCDNILACRVGTSVYYLNNSDITVTKKIAADKSITICPRTIEVVEDLKLRK